MILEAGAVLAGEYDAGLQPRNAAEYAGLVEHAECLQPTGWALLAMFGRPIRRADR
jgi:hypothetical protein